MVAGILGLGWGIAGLHPPSLAAQEPCAIAHRTGDGWDAYRRGDMTNAGEAFSVVYAACPGLSGARVGLGYVALRTGRVAAARGHFEAVLEGAPDHVDAVKGLARVEARQGRISESERRWRAVIQRDPDDVEALLGLGQISRWQGRFGDAAEWLERAEALDPQSAEVRAELEWLNTSIRPTAGTRLIVESDSDGNRMVTSLGHARWTPWPGFELRWDGYLRSTNLRGERSRTAFGHSLSTQRRLASGWSVRGGLGGSETDVLGVGVSPSGFLAVSSPNGRAWEGGVEVRSAAFDITTPTIERSVERRGLKLDLQVRPASRWRGTLSASAGAFEGTQSNGYWRSTVEVERQHSTAIRIGSRLRGFGFANDANDGYFDPAWFFAADLPFRWQRGPAPWGVEVEVAPGVQRSARTQSFEASFVSTFVGRYRLRPGRELLLSATWARSGAERFTAGDGSYSYRSIAAGAAWVF